MQATDLTVGVVVPRDDRFLFIEERSSGSLVLTQPGGHIESGETPEAAAEREALEESGCEVAVRELLGVYLWIQPQTRRQFLRIVYTADLIRQYADASLDTGIEGVHWLTAADLKRRSSDLRTPIVARCLSDYLKGQRQPQEWLAPMLPVQQNVPRVLANAALV